MASLGTSDNPSEASLDDNPSDASLDDNPSVDNLLVDNPLDDNPLVDNPLVRTPFRTSLNAVAVGQLLRVNCRVVVDRMSRVNRCWMIGDQLS